MKTAMGMFAALMVALAMTGVAFACWSQTLYIEGSVETGEVCVGYVDINCYDQESKEVGNIQCDLKDWKCYTPLHGNAYETLVITLSNVYPGYLAYCEITIANCGTIPVNLVDFHIYPIEDENDLLDFVQWRIESCDWSSYPQIDPCQEVRVTIGIEILQEVDGRECPQNSTATFGGDLTFCQWNECVAE